MSYLSIDSSILEKHTISCFSHIKLHYKLLYKQIYTGFVLYT